MRRRIAYLAKRIINYIKNKRVKRCKLGATYSVFNGEEILPFSLKSIRSTVDYINVVYQEISWTGKRCNDGLVEKLKKMKAQGLIDNVIFYNFAYNKEASPKKQAGHVLKKRNVGLSDLKKHKCTHCMILDADELFYENELQSAKKYFVENDFTHSACCIYDYMYSPTIRHRDVSSYSVPLFFKINHFSHLSYKHNLPCKVDDLRVIKYSKFFSKFFFFNSIAMHHMTGIRYNYFDKLDSSITTFTDGGKEYIESIKKEYSSNKDESIHKIICDSKNTSNPYLEVENVFQIFIDK